MADATTTADIPPRTTAYVVKRKKPPVKTISLFKRGAVKAKRK